MFGQNYPNNEKRRCRLLEEIVDSGQTNYLGK